MSSSTPKVNYNVSYIQLQREKKTHDKEFRNQVSNSYGMEPTHPLVCKAIHW